MKKYAEALDVAPMPVVIIKSPEELSTLAVEFGGCQTYNIPLIGTGPPVQLLTRRPPRDEAVLMLNTLGGASANLSNPLTNTGSVVTPGAGAQIVSVAGGLIGKGVYTATWNVEIDTAAATVPDNFALEANGSIVSTSMNGTAVGMYPNQLPATVVLPNNLNSVTVNAIAADATGTYKATVVLTPVTGQTINAASGIWLAHRPDYLSNPANPVGFFWNNIGSRITWKSQQPLYAVAIGFAGPTVSVIDQAQKATQAPAEEDVEMLEYKEDGQEEGSGSGQEYGVNRYE